MGKLTRIRAIPWLLLFEAARTVHSHVTDSLSPAERRRVTAILRETRGNPLNVTDAQRRELKAIAGKLDFKRMGSDFVPHAMRHARGRKSRR